MLTFCLGKAAQATAFQPPRLLGFRKSVNDSNALSEKYMLKSPCTYSPYLARNLISESLERRSPDDQLAPKGLALCYQQKSCGKALQATRPECLCWYDPARNINGSI